MLRSFMAVCLDVYHSVSAFVFIQVEKCTETAAALRSVKNEPQPEERPAATVNSVCHM